MVAVFWLIWSYSDFNFYILLILQSLRIWSGFQFFHICLSINSSWYKFFKYSFWTISAVICCFPFHAEWDAVRDAGGCSSGVLDCGSSDWSVSHDRQPWGTSLTLSCQNWMAYVREDYLYCPVPECRCVWYMTYNYMNLYKPAPPWASLL